MQKRGVKRVFEDPDKAAKCLNWAHQFIYDSTAFFTELCLNFPPETKQAVRLLAGFLEIGYDGSRDCEHNCERSMRILYGMYDDEQDMFFTALEYTAPFDEAMESVRTEAILIIVKVMCYERRMAFYRCMRASPLPQEIVDYICDKYIE